MGVSLESINPELIRHSWHNLPTEHCLLEPTALLPSLLVKLLMQKEVPVPVFQETEVYDIHCARCTGGRLFRNQESRNDWVWVQAGGEEMYGALRRRLPAKLMAVCKIWHSISDRGIRQLARIQMLTVETADAHLRYMPLLPCSRGKTRRSLRLWI